jgi:hypothetical protein
MTVTAPNDYASAWLACRKHLQTYEKKAALQDWQTAGEAAAQIQLLAAELIAYCDARLMPGTWETD